MRKLEDRLLIAEIGYYKFHQMKKAGFNSWKDFEEYKSLMSDIKKNEKNEKDKIRFRTIRFLERHCNIERKCQICGEWAEIHHPNYKDYLKINFLCKKHHTALHKFELIPPPIIDLEEQAIKKQNESTTYKY